MRLHFSLSPNIQPVPFDYPHFLTGAFHNWLGDNKLHDDISLYSLGWLQGGGARRGKLHFPRGASWFVSAPDTDGGIHLLECIANAALAAPKVCCGMEVVEIQSENTPEFGPRRVFRASSPVFIRGPHDKENNKDPYLLFHDRAADAALTHTLQHKLEQAGLGEYATDVKVRFDRSFQAPKTRLININGFPKRASVCPVIVEGAPEAVRFAWGVGAGNLTGSGFGSLI